MESEAPEPSILIGGPVSRREWIIEHYIRAVEHSVNKQRLNHAFIFLGDVANDPTFGLIHSMCVGTHKCFLLDVGKETPVAYPHAWTHDDYHRMVALRNRLLQEVRRLQPDYFLSLDSDILLAEPTIGQLLETVERYDAVGGKCYMTQPRKDPYPEGALEVVAGTHAPSYGKLLLNGNMRRFNSEAVFDVDILMAIKLMTPKAYNIDYKWDHRGEDLGWSENCRKAGLKLGWDGRTANKHVWEPRYLDLVDQRVGF